MEELEVRGGRRENSAMSIPVAGIAGRHGKAVPAPQGDPAHRAPPEGTVSGTRAAGIVHGDAIVSDPNLNLLGRRDVAGV